MYASQEKSQHMYSFGMGLSKSYMGISREAAGQAFTERTTSTDSRGASPTPQPRRRSHRPRGCRGGRKNRKNRESKSVVPAMGASAVGAASSSKSQQINCTQNSPAKGDLSHYHHVNTGTAWGTDNAMKGSSPMKRQMLPPPLPPFGNGHEPFVNQVEQRTQNEAGLKMLPSFDEPEMKMYLTASSKVMSSQQPLDLSTLLSGSDGTTIGTLVSSSSSGSEDDCTYTSTILKSSRIEMQRQQQLESGSLFVTSPRSFLLGGPTQNNDSRKPKIAVW